MLDYMVIWFALTVAATLAVIGAIGAITPAIGRILGVLALIVNIMAGFVLMLEGSYIHSIGLIVSIGASINCLRVILRRLNGRYLESSTQKDAVGLLVIAEICLATALIINYFSVSSRNIEVGLASLALTGSLYLLIITVIKLKHWRYAQSAESKNPSLTVAIPARNEDHALTDHLNKLIKSDYEKMEILVLDDCSQDATAEIIRSFAHHGVRFIKGATPKTGWLGKNYAYQNLLDDASGEFIVFAGVDIHFEPDSLKQLVNYMSANRLDMLSVLPQRRHLDAASTLLQPLRYIRELLISTRNNPPALSSCWIIRADKLKQLGGFSGIKNTIVPEAELAAQIDQGKYRFVISTTKLGITTRKRLNSQIDTAIRTLYPSLRRHIYATTINLLALVTVAIVPFWLVFSSSSVLATQLAAAALVVLALQQVMVLFVIKPAGWWLAIVQLPLAVAVEFVLIYSSMLSYEFGSVEWKGRNICLPLYLRH